MLSGMAVTIRELDRATDRAGIEAIDTSFETASVFDLVVTPSVPPVRGPRANRASCAVRRAAHD